KRSYWTGRFSLMYDGKPMEQIIKNKFVHFDHDAETRLDVKFIGNVLTGLAIVFPTGNYILLRKLKWYEYLLSFLPIVLIFGGAIGRALVAISMFVNVTICRKVDNVVLKVILTLAVLVVAYFTLSFIAGLLTALINGS